MSEENTQSLIKQLNEITGAQAVWSQAEQPGMLQAEYQVPPFFGLIRTIVAHEGQDPDLVVLHQEASTVPPMSLGILIMPEAIAADEKFLKNLTTFWERLKAGVGRVILEDLEQKSGGVVNPPSLD